MEKKFLMIIAVVFIAFLLVFSGLSDQNGSDQDQTDNEEETNGGDLLFNYAPVDLDKVLFIEPMGSMKGNHVTPIDHQYYIASSPLQQSEPEIVVDVYSPADGTVTHIQHMSSLPGDDTTHIDEYRLVIRHTSMVSSIFIHVDNLSEKIAEVAPPPGEYAQVEVSVTAGEIIGNYTGSIDYNIVDDDVVLTGFVVPESYTAEPWKIHTSDPFDYFNESIRNQLIALCLRSEKPEGGKIDHDIDGKLVGNWFKEGTNGYAGLRDNYWVGHLSIAYDSIDPDHVIVSFGSYDGQARQFGVKDNTPDPTDIGVETGLIKYELVGYDFYNGEEFWDRVSLVKGLEVRNGNRVQGVVLFQLIEDRKLKVEIFPDKTADEVSGFTENASIYVR